MAAGWMTDAEAGNLLSLSGRRIRQIAKAEHWIPREETCASGTRKLWNRRDVLAYAAGRGKAPLVTPDPTPALPAPTPTVSRDDVAWATVSTEGRRRAEARHQVVLAWKAWRREDSGIDAFVADWNAAHPDDEVSRPTLYRWMRDFQEHGVAGLVPGHYTRGATGSSIPPVLETYFDALWLRQSRPSIRMCHLMTENKAAELGIDCPSVSSFQRHVQALPKSTVVYGRKGNKALDDECLPCIRKDRSTITANQVWVADHHQVDVAVMGPNNKPVFPWVTVFMDERSRIYVGWHVCLTPNSDTIHLAFRRAVEDYGLPEWLRLDNGKDFRHTDFAGGRRTIHVEEGKVDVALLNRLDVKVSWALPYNAKAKPIERSFLILKEWFSKLWSSYRGGNVKEKPEQLAKVMGRLAELPTLDQFDVLFGQWVREVYNRMPCEGSGADGRRRCDIHVEEQPAERRVARSEDLALMLMRTKLLKVGRHGVMPFGKVGGGYWTDGFLDWQGKDVMVRWDVRNVDTVEVFDLDGRWICQAGRSDEMPVVGITGEEIRNAGQNKRRLRHATKEYVDALREQDLEPDPLRRTVLLRKAKTGEAVPPPERPGQVLRPIKFADRPVVQTAAKTTEETVEERRAWAALQAKYGVG